MARLLGTAALAIALSSGLGAAQLAPTDAGMFLGSWSLNLDPPQGSFEQSLVLKDEGGKVIAEISNQMQPDVQKVTDISKNGSDPASSATRRIPFPRLARSSPSPS